MHNLNLLVDFLPSLPPLLCPTTPTNFIPTSWLTTTCTMVLALRIFISMGNTTQCKWQQYVWLFSQSDCIFAYIPSRYLSLMVMKGPIMTPIVIPEMIFSVLLVPHPSRCYWHQILHFWNYLKRTCGSNYSWKQPKSVILIYICAFS